MIEQTTRSQSVNLLGFLRGQLSGLQGIPTLCYELIQNADDVKDDKGSPAASRITFDICDDALYVENNGVFRDIDFERMEKVSWGDKREEADTTGAFGIGFISVYQITDSPEIFSSGQHWQFHPEAPEHERIIVNRVETKYTRFRLPWAFEISPVRKELGISQVERSKLDDITKEMSEVIEIAALFLKQVKLLEVKRSGKIIRRIQTEREDDWLLVEDEKEVIRWRILEGDFAPRATEMRAKHGTMIEKKRKSLVTIAVPEVPYDKGLLYAFLPSETRTGLPFHINADFYPSSDRKRILLETGYKSDWNNLAIECAADTFATQVDKVLEIFPPERFWAVSEIIKRASETGQVSPAFSRFWQQLKLQIRSKRTVLTVGQELLTPTNTYYPRTEEQAEASKVFEELGLPIVHPSLYRYQNLLTDLEIGVQILKLTTVARAVQESGLTERTEFDRITQPSLRSKVGWTVLLNALNSLRERGSAQEQIAGDALLKYCAIALGTDNALWPPLSLFRTDQNTQELFSNFSQTTWYGEEDNNTALPALLVPRFGLRDGLKILEQNQSSLPTLWKNGKYSPQKIYEWLESFQGEIRNNVALRDSIRSLVLWPAAEGLLKPIKELYLTGDFEDPLHLAQLVDIDALGGRREFLETVLHVNKLDFVTYVRDWIPSVLKANQLTAENRLGLIQVMAEYLGKLQGQTDLQEKLSNIPLVWCGKESFFPAQKVCFDSKRVKEVLGTQVLIAFLPPTQTEAVRALYEWLGVAREPRPADILARIEDLTSSPPQNTNLPAIERIFAYLATQWAGWDEKIRQEFLPLRKAKWLPGTKNTNLWFDVTGVYAVYSSYLFESQGNFLKIDVSLQRRGSELIRFLNIASEPSANQVVRHLLYMSERGKPITPEFYVFLNRNAFDPAIHLLRNQPCLFLKTDKGECYLRPDQVFWEEHPFGYFRSRLGPEFGRFKDLFDKLDVKSRPDSSDAIKVLLEISEEFGKSNTKLDDRKDVVDVVIMCWHLLSSALEADEIDAKVIKKELGRKKTIPDSRLVLEPPDTLFFEDRPGWGTKFQLVKNNLIPRVERAWGAMEAAGVQRISKAVTTEIHLCENPHKNTDMRAMLSARKPLIQRVMEAHRSKGITDFQLEKLDAFEFTQAAKIEIVRTFKGYNRTERSDLEKVDAIYLDESLYFTVEEDQYPWISIARELAYVLHPSGELSSLGMELKEILSQTVEAASSALDEYGYPRIEIVSFATGDDQDIATLGGKEHLGDLPTQEGKPSGDDKNGSYRPESDGNFDNKDASQNGKQVSKKPENRKTSRLVSYVIPKDPTSEPNEQTELAARRNEIGQIGVDRVMEYEIAQKRTPTDMELIHVHHPGYDITSIDASGQARFIEVKSFTGIWDSQNPAQVTKTEFRTAREKGDAFWLYIVEKVETDDFKIHRICNPANQVDAYLFDHGWIHLANNDDEL
jgi:hypothetical protein